MAAACYKKGGGIMTYIENVFICMVSPLLIGALCMGKRKIRFFFFCFAGMSACMLSAYINTFFAALYKGRCFEAAAEIAPVVEEVMKFLPLLFFLLIFEPEPGKIKTAAMIVGLSFATFENVCYLIQNGCRVFFFHFLPRVWNGSDARNMQCNRGRRACVCMAAGMAENRRNLWSARGCYYLSRDI